MVDYKDNDRFREGRLYGSKFPQTTFSERQNTVLNTTNEIMNNLHKEGRITLLETQSPARAFVVTEPHLIVNERELEEAFVTVVDIVKRYPSTTGPAQARNSIQSLLGRNAARPYYFGSDTAVASDPATDLKERKEALIRELEVVNLELELARKKRMLAINLRLAATRTATGKSTATSTASMRRTAVDYEGEED